MREEPELTEAYRKDPKDEAFLGKLNAALAPYEDRDYKSLPERYPTLHVIGSPRSGTTLLMQLMAAHLDLGYINNLIAAFWQAPVYGIRLSKKLLPRRAPSSFQSDFGRTSHIQEPHEFGYFWSRLLNYDEMLQQDEGFERDIDWGHVRLILINMTHAFERPVAFKSVLLAWHVAKMYETLAKSCFVRVRRDPTQNALSLLRYRRTFLGSVDNWVSLKPAEYSWLKEEPYWRQVAGQVYFLEKAMTEQIARIQAHNVLEVRYEDLCRTPTAILRQIQELLEANGSHVNLLGDPPTSFESRARAAATEENYALVEAAVQEFYGR